MSEIELFSKLAMSGAAVGMAAFLWWHLTTLEREALEEEFFKTGVSVMLERGFQPDTIVVEAGQRVRLNFTRREISDWGDLTIPAFGQSDSHCRIHTIQTRRIRAYLRIKPLKRQTDRRAEVTTGAAIRMAF